MMIEDIIRQVVTDAAHDAVRDALDEIDLDPDPPAVPPPVEQRDPQALSVVEAAERLGISRSKLYELIRDGDLQTVQVGRRRLVMSPVVEEFLANNAEDKQATCRFCDAPAVASYLPHRGRHGERIGSAHADPACCAWSTRWPTAEPPLDVSPWNQGMRATRCMLPKGSRSTRPWRAEVDGLTERVKPRRSCT